MSPLHPRYIDAYKHVHTLRLYIQLGNRIDLLS